MSAECRVMKLIVPKYYEKFKCRGGICSDNCCIGWEIDIDEQTLEKYKSTDGSLGDRLKNNISHEETPHFVLCGERCPFLNRDNLCELIIERGEDYLCEICREHPRYYTTLGDTVYGGVGLSCEAAAELILTAENPAEFVTLETLGEREECDGQILEIILNLREKIFEKIGKNSQTIIYTIKETLRLAEKAQEAIDGEVEIPCNSKENTKIFDLFSKLEFMSGELPKLLTKPGQKNLISKSETVNKYLHNLLAYFIHRYLPKAVDDGFVLGKIAIAAASTMAIFHLFSLESELTVERAIYLSKLYSKEVEYNEENVEKLQEQTEKIIYMLENLIKQEEQRK